MILVTGGTGLLGSHLLFRLAENSNSIRAIYRASSNLDKVKKLFTAYSKNGQKRFEKIEWVQADINDIPALEKAFKGVTLVYHCAALISFDPKDFRKLRKINTKGTANIVNLCVTNAIQKLCYASTIGAIGKSVNGEMATEQTEWTETDNNVYALSKYAAELEVWRGSQEGLPVVMVNPGVIIGPTDWNQGSGKLFKTANRNYNFYPPGGTGFITVHDVVRMMIQLMDSSIKNQRFIAVSENLTYREILTRICNVLDKSPPKKQLKFWQLELFRPVDALWSKISGNERKLTKSTIRSFRNPQVFDNQKAKKELDFEFEDLTETIQFTAGLFLKDLA